MTIPAWLFALLCTFSLTAVVAWLTGALEVEWDTKCSLCGQWKSDHVGGRGGTCPRSDP